MASLTFSHAADGTNGAATNFIDCQMRIALLTAMTALNRNIAIYGLRGKGFGEFADDVLNIAPKVDVPYFLKKMRLLFGETLPGDTGDQISMVIDSHIAQRMDGNTNFGDHLAASNYYESFPENLGRRVLAAQHLQVADRIFRAYPTAIERVNVLNEAVDALADGDDETLKQNTKTFVRAAYLAVHDEFRGLPRYDRT